MNKTFKLFDVIFRVNHSCSIETNSVSYNYLHISFTRKAGFKTINEGCERGFMFGWVEVVWGFEKTNIW